MSAPSNSPVLRNATLFIGPAGAGKGEQGKRLNVLHVSSGDLFRAAKDQIDAAQRAAVTGGKLAVDETIRKLIADDLLPRLADPREPHHVVFDGVVRTGVDQARWLDDFVQHHRLRLDRAIVFDIADSGELWCRVQERAEREGRHEDFGSFTTRFQEYRANLSALETYYKKRLRRVPARASRDMVSANLCDIMRVSLREPARG